MIFYTKQKKSASVAHLVEIIPGRPRFNSHLCHLPNVTPLSHPVLSNKCKKKKITNSKMSNHSMNIIHWFTEVFNILMMF